MVNNTASVTSNYRLLSLGREVPLTTKDNGISISKGHINADQDDAHDAWTNTDRYSLTQNFWQPSQNREVRSTVQFG
jgi:hypothetical protein